MKGDFDPVALVLFGGVGILFVILILIYVFGVFFPDFAWWR